MPILLCVVAWGEAVVAHEPVHAIPRQCAAMRLAREAPVKSLRTRAAGQADGGALLGGHDAG